jgi:hypothetical protein
MTTPDITRVHAGVLKHHLSAVILQEHDSDSGFVIVGVIRAYTEQHSRASREGLRPAMSGLSRSPIELRERDRLPSSIGVDE